MLVSLLVSEPTRATQFRTGSVVSVRDAEILDDVIAAGGDLSFDSHILGDVIAVGRTVTLGDSAVVDNSFMGFGQKVDVNGTVINSARVFAQDFSLRGHVERNVMGFAQSILIDSHAWVEKDVSFACGQLILRGRVGGNLSGGAGTITISGQIDGDVKIEGDKIVVLQGAIVGGSFKYRSEHEAKIEDGVQILGGVERLTEKEDGRDKDGYTLGSFFWDAWWYLSSLALGIVMILLFRGFMMDVSSTINGSGLKSLGLGLLFLICLPIAAVAVALTLVGIPAAALIVLLWVVLLYLSEIYVGLALGEWLLGRLRRDATPRPVLSLVVGLLIITLFSAIPFVGTWIALAIGALAMGGFFIVAYNRRAKTPA
jgi:cytoskeletal protein CcmA (bactofilin family)